MAGVKGSGGPIPKRSDQRRRRNKPDLETTKVAVPAGEIEPAEAKASWHPIAKRWYESLGESGQAKFYEPSDWALAYIIAESLSRELRPQVIGATKEGEPVRASIPIKGSSMSAYLRAMTALLVTEGDRRRLRLEVQRSPVTTEDGGEVSWIDDARRRLRETDPSGPA